jgi:hypothetical protein
MRIALLAAGVFAAAFLVHWLWWRVRIPGRQTAVLLGIFFTTLGAWGLAAGLLPESLLAPRSIWELLHVAMFHVALSLAYVVAYSAIEHRSPSMTVLTFVADAGAAGRPVAEVRAILEAASPVETRLAAMLREGMVQEADGAYRLAVKGRAWAVVLSNWRRFLRLPRGG